jgi:hypothetical protein
MPSQDKVNLTEDLLLAKGGERLCYINPNDTTKVIKVLDPNIITHNRQNDLEYTYYNLLYSKYDKNTLLNIAKCYGWADTNYGKGLMFERIIDYNGQDSKHLRYYLRNHLLSEQQETLLLTELKEFLESNLILFVDVSTVNLFCKEISRDKFTLVIFDGLGARRYNFKFFLYMKISFLAQYKLKKQWNKFIINCKKDKLNKTDSIN